MRRVRRGPHLRPGRGSADSAVGAERLDLSDSGREGVAFHDQVGEGAGAAGGLAGPGSSPFDVGAHEELGAGLAAAGGVVGVAAVRGLFVGGAVEVDQCQAPASGPGPGDQPAAGARYVLTYCSIDTRQRRVRSSEHLSRIL